MIKDLTSSTSSVFFLFFDKKLSKFTSERIVGKAVSTFIETLFLTTSKTIGSGKLYCCNLPDIFFNKIFSDKFSLKSIFMACSTGLTAEGKFAGINPNLDQGSCYIIGGQNYPKSFGKVASKAQLVY